MAPFSAKVRIAATGPDIKVGAQASVLMRPEKVLVGAVASTCENNFESKVTDVIYYGDHLRLLCAVCGHEDFIVKIPNDGEAGRIQVGDSLAVGWRAEASRALQ